MNTKKFILAVAILMLFASLGVANAVNFTISNVGFGKFGNNEAALRWDVSSPYTGDSTLSHDIAVGSSWTFTYGAFNLLKRTDTDLVANDDNDYFTVNFGIVPPTPAYKAGAETEELEAAKVRHNPNMASIEIEFDHAVKEVLFGNGGKYRLVFNDAEGDLNKTSTPGSHANNLDLTATITLLKQEDVVVSDNSPSGPTAPSPVPEPGTVVLMGVGMAAVALYRRSRRS